ncbi:MAG TPA: cupredoxin domain-containing protein [Actinomycetota bacterium]|nr:cupredoxin domain-containing protein [Actinomycetota bacterium]
MRRAGVTILAVALLALFACGGDDEPATTTPAPEDQADAASSTLELAAVDFSFSPPVLTVAAGAEVTVTFTNDGESPHTFSSDDLGFDVRADPGASEEVTFTAPEEGTSEFQCNLHPQMKGTVELE